MAFNQKRRNFLVLTTSAIAGLGAASSFLPFIKSISPSAEVRAQSTVEVNVASMTDGQSIKVMWQGKPVFIRKRTKKEIEEAKSVDLAVLRDPEPDDVRTKPGKPEWLIMVGICTHLGCIPVGESGDYNGWFCPCHGSHYDTAGRIRKGPAPKNLVIPEYTFINDNVILIGSTKNI